MRQMDDLTIKPGAIAKLGRVDGGLRVGRNATIRAESGGKVVVADGAYFECPVTIDCDFECKSMKVEGKGFGPAGDVVVRGDLTVEGDAELDASVEIEGDVTTERLDIGGHLDCGSVTSKMVRVGGHLSTRGDLKSGDVDVGGHLKVHGQVDIANLRAGGHAEIGGGTIRGEIKVRGHFETKEKLAFGSINVFGKMKLPAGSTGERLTALGKIKFEGDASCKVMEVNGVAEVNGDCSAESIKVNGKLSVDGSLTIAEKAEIFGSAEARGKTECGALAVGGRLVSDSIVSHSQAEVAGEVWTTRGLKAKSVQVGTGSRVNGPIIGETVEIGKGLDLRGFWAHATNWRSVGRPTRVDDVYGKEVTIDRYSRAKRIYAQVVKMQGGSMADDVSYTHEADVPAGVHLEGPAKKVASLPDAPL
ncbi:MAG TPA: hypothetical protein VED22_03640 [Nitrososphaerales archaeon]|nr:hypothetical protein [Nitrososphaerales archaeon]